MEGFELTVNPVAKKAKLFMHGMIQKTINYADLFKTVSDGKGT